MREIRQSGSEGGGGVSRSLPLSSKTPSVSSCPADAGDGSRLGEDAALVGVGKRTGPAFRHFELDRLQRLGGVGGVVALPVGLAVKRRADARGAAEARDQAFHRIGRQFLAVLGAGC